MKYTTLTTVGEQNVRARRISFSAFALDVLGSLCCIVLPSFTSVVRSPSDQALRRLSRHLMFTFDLLWGSCRVSIGRTVVAIRAMDSIAETLAKALYSLASSATKDLPAFPKGTLKLFILH